MSGIIDEGDFTFPSQHAAEKYSRLGVEKVEEMRKIFRQKKSTNAKIKMSDKYIGANTDDANGSDLSSEPCMICDVEALIISAIRLLTCHPGIDAHLAEEAVGRPYADSMRKVLARYPDDPEVSYLFAESLMVCFFFYLETIPSQLLRIFYSSRFLLTTRC